MGGFKRTLTVSYGFVQSICDLSSSRVPEDRETKLTQVCVGAAHGKTHDPIQPKWDPFCPACDKSVGRTSLAKASQPVKGQFVVMTAEEIAALKSDDDQYKGKLALTAHEAGDVEGKTIPSGTTYHLAPNPKDQFFGLLREMILDCPDLWFLGRYTVSSRASTYRVRPYASILVAEQMLDPEELLTPPIYEPTPIPQNMLDMAQQVARGFVTPYDPADYADQYKIKLSEALGVRQATPGADVATAVPGTPGMDPMAQMAALMAAAVSAAGTGSDEAAGEGQKAAPKRTRKKAS